MPACCYTPCVKPSSSDSGVRAWQQTARSEPAHRTPLQGFAAAPLIPRPSFHAPPSLHAVLHNPQKPLRAFIRAWAQHTCSVCTPHKTSRLENQERRDQATDRAEPNHQAMREGQHPVSGGASAEYDESGRVFTKACAERQERHDQECSAGCCDAHGGVSQLQ
jgi:hypothetical protein